MACGKRIEQVGLNRILVLVCEKSDVHQIHGYILVLERLLDIEIQNDIKTLVGDHVHDHDV